MYCRAFWKGDSSTMKRRIFVTATNTDIGKTYTTKKLMKMLSDMGYTVGVVKPIETGVEDGNYPDGEQLLSLLKQYNPQAWALDIEDVVPISFTLPAAPYIASGGAKIAYEKIDAAIAKQEQLCDVLLIEGAGGLYVPVEKSVMMIDLIERLQAKALLVSHCRLGCINDTLIHKKALQDKGIVHEVVLNCRDEEQAAFGEISFPYFQEVFDEVFTIHNLQAVLEKLLV